MERKCHFDGMIATIGLGNNRAARRRAFSSSTRTGKREEHRRFVQAATIAYAIAVWLRRTFGSAG
jgi:hypothetical protein